MPITITITADSAKDARREMRELLNATDLTPNQLAGVRDNEARSAAEAAPEKPRAARSTKKPNAETVAALEAAERGETETVTIEQLQAEAKADVEPVTPESLRARATSYAAKAGPIALVEMQKTAGAANGKMSEVTADQAIMTKLDALLADAGF